MRWWASEGGKRDEHHQGLDHKTNAADSQQQYEDERPDEIELLLGCERPEVNQASRDSGRARRALAVRCRRCVDDGAHTMPSICVSDRILKSYSGQFVSANWRVVTQV